MAERARSKDGSRETTALVDEAKTPAHQGRAEGELARAVGTRDALRRALHGDNVTTRVRKSDEKGQGDLGGHHGTGDEDEYS